LAVGRQGLPPAGTNYRAKVRAVRSSHGEFGCGGSQPALFAP
jgi:hypothetical protein